MSQGPELAKENTVTRQRLTQSGIIGAALFVGAPSVSVAMATISVTEFVKLATNEYASKAPEEALFHPAIYLCLLAAGLYGLVMLLVGRESYTVALPPAAQPKPKPTEWQ